MNSTEALPKFVIKRDGSVKDFDITKSPTLLLRQVKRPVSSMMPLLIESLILKLFVTSRRTI